MRGCAAFVFHLLRRRKLINESVGSIMSEEPVGLPETPRKTTTKKIPLDEPTTLLSAVSSFSGTFDPESRLIKTIRTAVCVLQRTKTSTRV